jgi:hypothetical protein
MPNHEYIPTPASDRAAIIQAFNMIVGEGTVTELRALDATIAGDRWAGVFSGYFDNAEAFADAAMNIRNAKGIYFIPNPVDPALLARACNRIRRAPRGESTADTNIVRRKWLLIDADAVRPSGISANAIEHEAAHHRMADVLQFLHDERGWGDPIEADSGNGAHLLYPVDAPTDDGGVFHGILKDLSSRFSDNKVTVDTSVFNASRIWKLYGTPACKGDSTSERPHRLARILNAPRELNGGVSWC